MPPLRSHARCPLPDGRRRVPQPDRDLSPHGGLAHNITVADELWLDNWVEQSSGCMYTYALVKAIDAGYVSAPAFRPTAQRGYEGILSNLELRSVASPAHNEVYLYGTCIGTSVGPTTVGGDSYAYYRDRPQKANDLHGQGAFLFASEVQRTRYSDLRQLVQAGRATRDGLSRFETDNRGFTGVGGVARFNSPSGIIVDVAGNIYVADTLNHTLRLGQLPVAPTIQVQPQSQAVMTIGSMTSDAATLTVIPAPPPPSGGGGGGGGAMEPWFVVALALLGAATRWTTRKN